MSPSRTLAERFRTQRTDRIRVDGNEVVSVVDLILEPTSAVELAVESQRDDVEQLFSIRSRTRDVRAVGEEFDEIYDAPVELIQVRAKNTTTVELVGSDASDTLLQLWNGWRIDTTDHSWTGNSGIVVEDLTPPEGAKLRFRMWCSDGLGDPSFDDLVLIVTVGDRIPQNER